MYPWLPEWFNSIILSFVLIRLLNIKFLENIFTENTDNGRLGMDMISLHSLFKLPSIKNIHNGDIKWLHTRLYVPWLYKPYYLTEHAGSACP
jgi:hypothetical protein